MAKKKATTSRKTKRSQSPGSDTQKKSKRSKFEDFAIPEVEEEPPTATPPPAAPAEIPQPLSSEDSGDDNEENGKDTKPEGEPVQSNIRIPIAALQAEHVPQAAEAVNGLLAEPPAPDPNAPRVTKDGEPAPPIPLELLDLLSG